jgi:hypothetical protein
MACGVNGLEKQDYLLFHDKFLHEDCDRRFLENFAIICVEYTTLFTRKIVPLFKLLFSKVYKSEPHLVGLLAVRISVLCQDAW